MEIHTKVRKEAEVASSFSTILTLLVHVLSNGTAPLEVRYSNLFSLYENPYDTLTTR